MFNFDVLKFFGINICSSKVLSPIFVRWEFPSLGWVKIHIDDAARGSPGLATLDGIFCGSMRKFIGSLSVFLDVQTII